ncbi:hypothetical protein TherJR_0396 [Thermincola potens JR]|uniref:Uncharacterized protein n=2 Tax=Thermincola TaxID=278993 RepID=D5XAI3_THEPJ|nr:hypothetical protein TherJR_0396 [Thermincola potens JR]
MGRMRAVIFLIFLLFFLTLNPLLSFCSEGSSTSDKSITGEVKLYEAVEVKDNNVYGEEIGFWSPTGGEVGIWDKIWGTVSDVISDAIDTVGAWFAGTSFIEKVFLAALVVFAAVAVAILLIFGSAAVLAAVVIGLIGAAIVGIYAAFVGEDGFSFWTAVGLGIGGSILAVVVHFTGAAVAVLGFLTETALPWVTRVALPAIGRLMLRGWRVFTNRFLPWVGLQLARVWGFFSSTLVPKLFRFFLVLLLGK